MRIVADPTSDLYCLMNETGNAIEICFNFLSGGFPSVQPFYRRFHLASRRARYQSVKTFYIWFDVYQRVPSKISRPGYCQDILRAADESNDAEANRIRRLGAWVAKTPCSMACRYGLTRNFAASAL
jgi:hypothetical protein